MEALVRNEKGAFVPQKVSLSTLKDPITVSGDAAQLIGGARILVDGSDPRLQQAQTEQDLIDIFVKSKGGSPRANYVEQDGVLWPTDFDTWNLVTTYYNFEQAFVYFRDVVQISSDELSGAKVYYFPSFTITSESTDPLVDDALFYSPIQAFVILPFKSLQKVPLSMNPWVIAHEFSHRVFNKRVYDGKAFPDVFGIWGAVVPSITPGLNLLSSLDEGLADFHAVGASCASQYGCDTRGLAASFGDDADVVSARDMSENKCLNQSLYEQLMSADINTFKKNSYEYRVGTVIASALYHAASETPSGTVGGSRVNLERAVVATYASDGNPQHLNFNQMLKDDQSDQNKFSRAAVADAILQHVSDTTLAANLCSEFMDRLQIPRDQLPDCPGTAATHTNCPAITP